MLAATMGSQYNSLCAEELLKITRAQLPANEQATYDALLADLVTHAPSDMQRKVEAAVSLIAPNNRPDVLVRALEARRSRSFEGGRWD